MKGLRPYSHEDRARLIRELVDRHKQKFGDNLVGLATQVGAAVCTGPTVDA